MYGTLPTSWKFPRWAFDLARSNYHQEYSGIKQANSGDCVNISQASNQADFTGRAQVRRALYTIRECKRYLIPRFPDSTPTRNKVERRTNARNGYAWSRAIVEFLGPPATMIMKSAARSAGRPVSMSPCMFFDLKVGAK